MPSARDAPSLDHTKIERNEGSARVRLRLVESLTRHDTTRHDTSHTPSLVLTEPHGKGETARAPRPGWEAPPGVWQFVTRGCDEAMYLYFRTHTTP